MQIIESNDFDPKFKPKDRRYNDIVMEILNRKTICLRCHNMNLLDPDCDCNAKIIKYSNFKVLIKSNIKKLRKGIPAESYRSHPNWYGIRRDLQDLKDINRTYYIGYNKNDNYSNFCPVNVWDLERLYLIGLNFWSILYSEHLGAFAAILQVKFPLIIPIPRPSVKYSYFLFVGYHKTSNKEVLILSKDDKVDINGLNNLKKLKKKIKTNENQVDISKCISRHSLLYNELIDTEWYLYFTLGENIIIVPQERSKLDIRFLNDLEPLMNASDILSDYKKKRYLLDWDKDDEL